MKLLERLRGNDDVSVPFLLFLLTLLTRIPFTEKMMYHMDSVQYALALGHYDVTVHQPHPPGYFLYVMLGRLANLFARDPHAALLFLSILFSGFTVVAIHYLAKELYDGRCALIAALLAITSPNLWFHGEVALNYVIEAFLSTIVATICWRIIRGKTDLVPLSAIILAASGGIRQNSPLFLLPLWLIALGRLPLRGIMGAVALFGFASLCWFVPMVLLTGGMERYADALRQLWLFTGAHNSVFERGWPAFRLYAATLFDFTIYGTGAGIGVFIIRLYLRLRNGAGKDISRTRAVFYAAWLLPSILFYLLIIIHPAVPGYGLVFLPPLLILLGRAVVRTAEESRNLVGRNIGATLAAILVGTNLFMFFFAKYPVSHPHLREHDRNLPIILDGLRTFDPASTVLFVNQYAFYGFSHVMYYLPEYTVAAPTGETGKVFSGNNRMTALTEKLNLPSGTNDFASLLISDNPEEDQVLKGLAIKEVLPSCSIVSGPVSQVGRLYPGLKVVMASITGT